MSDRFTPITQHIVDLLTANKVALALQDIYYGDQAKIPRLPAACVESGAFNRTLSGIGGKGRTDNTVRTFIFVYHGGIKDIQISRKDVEVKAEEIMDVLHQDVTMGGLVVHGFVTSIEPGYATTNGILMHASRITWDGLSKTLIA